MGGTPIGFGRTIPSAEPTLAPVGQEAGAAVVLGLTSASGLGDGVEALGDAEPPQDVMLATTTTEASPSRQEPSIQRLTRRCYSAQSE